MPCDLVFVAWYSPHCGVEPDGSPAATGPIDGIPRIAGLNLPKEWRAEFCLLYTTDAAAEPLPVGSGARP